jgi:PAS domain S-box-containing protein
MKKKMKTGHDDSTGLRKRAGEALRKSEEKYRLLVENSPDVLYTLDTEGVFMFVSSAWTVLLGHPVTQVVGKPFLQFVHPDDLERCQAFRKRTIETGQRQTDIEYRVQHADGTWRWHATRAVPQKDDAGTVVGYEAIASDITERKQAEESTKVSEERYRMIFDEAPMGIAISTMDGKIVDLNKAQAEMIGSAVEELRGRSVDEYYVDPDKRREMIELFNKAGKVRDFEMELKKKDGSIIVELLNLDRYKIGGKDHLFATGRDITERTQAEKATKNTLRFQQVLMDAVPSPIFYKDAECVYLGGNKAFERYVGLSSEQFVGKTVYEISPVDLAEKYDKADRELLNNPGVQTYEATVVYANGTRHDVVFNKAVFTNAEGKTAGLVGVILDITERKQAEEALKNRESMLQKIFDILPVGLWLADKDGKLLRGNPEGVKIWGAEPKVGLSEYGVFKGRRLPSGEEVAPNDWALAHTIRDKVTIVDELLEIDAFDGKKKTILNYTAPVLDAQGNIQGALVVNQDITERKRAEEAVKASLREKEILLREIHHRVKNNMQIISSLFNLQAGYIKDEDARRMLREGQLRIRAMALVHEKLYQSRDMSKIDFSDYLRSLSDHLFHFFSVEADRIRLETNLEHVQLDVNSAVPCGLLATELITNALKHAFPGDRKGVVGVRLYRREDGAVELHVSDDGVGFPEAVDFRKTGSLGLQIVSLLVGQLEGTIELDRENGAAFTIVFRELGYRART